MLPDYPFATSIPADSSNYHTAERQSYTLVILHVTDGHGDPIATAKMWQEPHHGSSAHFVVGQDGTVVQAVALKDIAWHAHKASYLSVGVEHCARTPGELSKDDPGLPVSDQQYAASSKLVAWLLKAAGLPCDRKHVMGHAEADPETTHDKCPTGAPGWDWTRWMTAIQAEYDAIGDGPVVG